MGSEEIEDLEYRQGFCFIGVLGRKEFTEKRADANTKGEVSVTWISKTHDPEQYKKDQANMQSEEQQSKNIKK